MKIFDLIDWVWGLWDFCTYWKFNLCLILSVLFAIGVASQIPNDTLDVIAGIFIVVTGVVMGILWERRS